MNTTFVAKDADGKAYTIRVVTRKNAAPLLGGAAYVDDTRLETEAGEEVVRGPAEFTYRVVATGVDLTTTDTDAP